MIIEEQLPDIISQIDYEKGCAQVTRRTVIKRDGEVIHTTYKYQDIEIESLATLTAPLLKAVDDAAKIKTEADKLASEFIALDALN